jgi:aldehyde:ferredoxin oxidoreductase
MKSKAADLGRILYIDLSNRKFWVENRTDLFRKYLGGTGVGIQLLLKDCPANIDAFDPKNPIIFTVGYLNALYPLGSKCVAMFKSPHTGDLGESHAGGRVGVSLRMAGYGGVVIIGRSEIPIYLAITEKGVKFHDASTLWGMSSSFTAARLIRNKEAGSGQRCIMHIGQAGENLVTYASVMTETYRHFGRLGLGAVFGSKNLKAIMIQGNTSLEMGSPKDYRKIYDSLFNTLAKSPLMKKYHDIGTPINIMVLNEVKGLPTKNLTQTTFEFAENLSGEELAKNYLGRRTACAHCPVSCIHLATLRVPYPKDPYFFKSKFVSYDHEPIFAIGTMLGLSTAEDFLELMDQVEKFSIDVMSVGVTLAWATEAFQKGIITEKETLGLKLQFGDVKGYLQALCNIVQAKNDFYRAMARGTEYVANKYGGLEFACTCSKNEMAGYHTGIGSIMGYMVGARHSHLDGAGYSLDLKYTAEKKTLSPLEAADYLFKEESWRQILSSLVVCFFARNVYTPEIIAECLKAIHPDLAQDFTPDRLKALGEEILIHKHQFKAREGFQLTANSYRIPERFCSTTGSVGPFTIEQMKEGLDHFAQLIQSRQSKYK